MTHVEAIYAADSNFDAANAGDLHIGRGRSQRLEFMSASAAAQLGFLAGWDAIAATPTEPNPFFERWFLLPSLANLDEQSNRKIVAHFHGDHLAGLIPLIRSKSYYGHAIPHVTTWLHENAFCGAPLVAQGFECDFWRALFDELDRSPGTALFLHLPELPTDGVMSQALDRVLKESDRLAVTVDSAERAMLSSDLKPEAYLSKALSAKKRKELRRQHKRLSEQGNLTFERQSCGDSLENWIAEFLALEASGWKGRGGSALANDPKTSKFFADTLIGASEAHRLERLTLRLDGQPIAMLANFITPPGAFSFKTAFDERFARFSPGLLLQLENLRLLDRPDIDWSDSCAVEGHSMIERIWREKRRVVSRNIAIGGRLRRTAFAALMTYETRKRSDA